MFESSHLGQEDLQEDFDLGLFLSKLNFEFNVKNIDISFICVLDFIHTHYTSKVFKYLIFVLIQV